MRSVSGHFWEVVASESQTAGGLNEEKSGHIYFLDFFWTVFCKQFLAFNRKKFVLLLKLPLILQVASYIQQAQRSLIK